MIRYQLFILINILLTGLVSGQEIPCGTDWLHQESMHNAIYKKRFLQQQDASQQYFRGNLGAPMRLQVLTLPVVVHIIHENGPENISDATVLQGIQQLNEAFANTGYYDQDNGVNTMIQFCLALRTPQGGPTSGITRDQNPLTNMTMETEDIALKDINRWNPNDYINIWLVAGINSISVGPGVAGYAYFPSSHGQPEDGIVIESGFLGSSPGGTGVLVHEMGHYLGLYHTFEGGCTNDDCLADGDRVCDTPPDQSTAWTPCNIPVNTCNTDVNSGFPTDVDDMIINYMDYTDFNCFNAFTQGQSDRMDWFINNVRQSLLLSQACQEPCLSPIFASFLPQPGVVNAGQTINFNSNSTNATQFEWIVNGIPAGTNSSLNYTFSNTGIYTLQLNAYNADPNCLDTFLTSIFVACDISAGFNGVTSGNNLTLTNTSTGSIDDYEWTVFEGVTTTVFSTSSSGAVYTFPTDIDVVNICLTVSNDYCENQVCQYFYAALDSTDCDPTFLRTFGGSTIQDLEATDITPSQDGNFYFCGKVTTGLVEDGIIGKIDGEGNLIWTKTIGNTGNDKLVRIKTTFDGGILAVGTATLNNQDGWLVRTDANGNVLWSKRFDGGSSDYSVDVYEMPNHDIVVASTANNFSNIFLTKLSATGTIIWQKAYPYGYVYDVDGTADGNLIISGASTIFGFGMNDSWVVKVSATDGSFIWGKAMGQPMNDGMDFVMSTSDGGFLMMQNWHDAPGTYDTYVHKTDAAGNLTWSKLINGVLAQMRSYSALENPDGSFVICLQDLSVPSDMKLAKMSPAGALLWSRSYDTGAGDVNMAVAPLSNGGFISVGFTDQDRIFIARTDSTGGAAGCGVGEPAFSLSSPFIQMSNTNFTPTDVSWTYDFVSSSQNIFLTTQNVCENPCTVEICDNGIDDDGDNLFDCLDDDCPCSDCDPGYAKVWCFGDHAGLDFNTDPPTVFNTSQVVTFEGEASISDPNGTLLFYSDGINVWNRLHLLMPNGFGLSGHPSSTQSAVIVPHPGNNHLFYLFTVDYGDGLGGLRYSLVDMSLDTGLGDIVPGQKDISLWSAGEEKLNAVKHCNNQDIWVVSHDQTDEFRAYLVTSTGLNTTPVISHIGSSIGISTAGYLKFSPNGRMAANAVFAQEHTDLFDFDNENGFFSNYRIIESSLLNNWHYGVEFSANSKLLYVSSLEAPSRLVQFDLTSGVGDITSINNSAVQLATHPGSYYFGAIQSAPNGKMYVTNSGPLIYGQSLGIINNPNIAGTACNYVGEAQPLGNGGANLGLPTFVQSYFLDEGIDILGTDSLCQVPAQETYFLSGVSCEINGVIWQLDGNILPSNTDSVAISFTMPGIYELTVQAYNECGSYFDTLEIFIDDVAGVLDLGPDQMVCDNGVVLLEAGDFQAYRWQNGWTESTFTAPAPGTYWVDVWDLCGNQQTDTIHITLIPATALDAGANQTICRGSSVTFNLQGFESYQWIPGDWLSCDDCANPVATPDTTIQYLVIGQTAAGCISVDTVLLEVTEDTIFLQIDTAICQGEVFVFNNQSFPAGSTTEVFFENINGCDSLITIEVSSLDTFLFVVDTIICAGDTYSYNGQEILAGDSLLLLYNSINGCDSTILIRVGSLPPVVISLAVSDTMQLGETYTINANVQPQIGITLSWTPADGLSCSDCPNPEVNILQNTSYTLVATDSLGCAASAAIQLVVILNCDIFVPNAFSPDNNGINDNFFIMGEKACVEEIAVMRVFDRWGEMIFENEHFPVDEFGEGWDGKFRNKLMSSDVYVWYAEVVYIDGRVELLKGDVTLIR